MAKAKVRKCFWCRKRIEQYESKSRLRFLTRSVYVHSDSCLRPTKKAKIKIRSFATQSSKLMLRYLRDILNSQL